MLPKFVPASWGREDGLGGGAAHASPCSALGVVQSPWDDRDMAVHEEIAGGGGERGEPPVCHRNV